MNNEYIIDLAGVAARKELHERIEAALPVPESLPDLLHQLHGICAEHAKIFCGYAADV